MLFVTLFGQAQSLYMPGTPTSADSVKVPVNIAGTVRTMYLIDFIKYRATNQAIRDSLLSNAFTLRNSKSSGDSLLYIAGSSEAIVKRLVQGTNITLTPGDSTITIAAAGSSVSGANPSASVGLSAVNGSASTFMRSDAAPAISQAITPTWTGAHTFRQDYITSTTDGIVLSNLGDASSGTPSQQSPRIRWTGTGWKTASTAASQVVDWLAEMRPQQGTANPSGNLVFSSRINAGTWIDQLTLLSNGNATLTGNLTAVSLIKSGGTSSQFLKADGSVDANTYQTATSTATLSNKRWTPRVGSTTSSATPTINTDNYDVYKLTAQAADITSFTTNLSGTPADGDVLEVQITGTAARAITWGSSFVSSTVTLPTTTISTATLTVIFQYYTTSSYGNNKWVCASFY